MLIRRSSPADFVVITTLLDAAFAGPVESKLVRQLHADGAVLADYVAVEADDIVGYLLLCPVQLEGSDLRVAAIAPVAVVPAQQRRGIGSALMRQALADSPALQIDALLILGDPAFYGRFGFTAKAAQEVRCAWSGPHLMALAVNRQCDATLHGQAVYPTAFDGL